MAAFGLHTLKREQLRAALLDAWQKLTFVRETIQNIPEAHIPFPRLQEISFLEQRIREYQMELARRWTPHTSVHMFYSYSRNDESLLVELDEHLSLLKSEAAVKVFWDRDQEPGIEWHTEIRDELRDAEVVLLLVSPDFLTSRYCRQVELPAALDLHDSGLACTIPIILKPCAWQETVLGRLQAIPRDGKPIVERTEREEAWADAAREISLLVNRIRQGS